MVEMCASITDVPPMVYKNIGDRIGIPNLIVCKD
jgi:hypothetical protein